MTPTRDTPPRARLTPAMRRWLANLLLGRPGDEGLAGRSAHGGAVGTVFALKLRGLIDAGTGQITDAGRAAMKTKL